MIMRAVGATHQYLSKPCDPDTLRSAVNGALQLRMLLNEEPSLMPLIARIETLPCMPALYTKIVDELRQPDPSIAKISTIVSQDPSMAAKVLQLVNSAFFGLAQQITKLDRAVCLIGLDAIKALVLSARVFTELTKGESLCICMDTLWEHSLLVGNLAKKISMAEKATADAVNDSLTAGLLHDIGQLILAANLSSEYAQVRALAEREEYELNRVEELEFGATHAGLGAYLLGIWGLPNSIVEAVAFHHEPEQGLTKAGGFSALTALHVANALVHEHCEHHGCGAPERLNLEYLEAQGLADKLPKWREIASDFFAAENVAA
jgi:HD-like signal output (HDOD) protein